jgi:opacity protein-like surface antigen
MFFLRLFVVIFIALFSTESSFANKSAETDVLCPAGTNPKVFKRKHSVRIVCVDSVGRFHNAVQKSKPKTKINTIKQKPETIRYVAPYPASNNNVLEQEKPTDQTIIRHYYVPLQKSISAQGTDPKQVMAEGLVNQEVTRPQIIKEASIADSFEGFYLGLMYHSTFLNASNTATSEGFAGAASTGKFVQKENQSIVEHGPTGVIGYNTLFLNQRMLVGIEARMGYSILDSNYFNGYTTRFGTATYNYHNFANNTFNWPSIHARVGVLLFERFLPYVTAGLGVYTINYGNDKQATYSGGSSYYPYSVSGNKTSVNFPVGGGLEFALNQHIHLRLEYLYTIYIAATENYSAYNGANTPSRLTYDYTLGSHSVLFGVMLYF